MSIVLGTVRIARRLPGATDESLRTTDRSCWPASERPRERFRRPGPGRSPMPSSSPSCSGTGGVRVESAMDRGAEGISREFRWSLPLSPGDARRARRDRPGLGVASAAAVVAALELGRRAASSGGSTAGCLPPRAPTCSHTFAAGSRPSSRKTFVVLLLDAKHRKLREVRISEGSLTAALVHPREVFAPAVRESAAALVLVHNHPSGDPSPSPEDRQFTRSLREAGEFSACACSTM